MKRILLLAIIILSWTIPSTAHPVDQATAKAVAIKFMGTRDLILSATYQTDLNVPAFYIFNTTNGFVIVSADDCETPVIGYSHEGRFDPDNIPVQMEGYLQDFVARIQYGVENHIEADQVTKRQWQLVKATGRLNNSKSPKTVGPLLTERWHQGCLYNSLCPAMSGPCGRAEAGCVAVAMGQIMHYWRYPATGWGSRFYYYHGVPFFADFENTIYDWSHMPDSLTDTSNEVEIEAVATLLYHCGISVKMSYTVNGSSASSGNIPDALIRYFNYSRHLHREKQTDYSDEEWLSIIKNNLDLQQPVQYSGFGSAGHSFVCDGYDDNNMLHFNWGWGGNADGFFALGNLNPIGFNFNSDNYAILDIVPQYEPCQIVVPVYPPSAGIVQGVGEYHIGESCKLTAVPAESCEFCYWEKNGQILTHSTTYTIDDVEDDILDIEAHFSLGLPKHIYVNHYPNANNPGSPYVNLSWGGPAPSALTLLKSFEISSNEQGIGTDGEHIYTIITDDYKDDNKYALDFCKYNMDGELLETFSIEGCGDSHVMTYNGNYFFLLSELRMFYCVDFYNKTLVNSVRLNSETTQYFCTFDPINNGFWVWWRSAQNNEICLRLIDDHGLIIREGPQINSFATPYSSSHLIAKDGTQHLLFYDSHNHLYDYNLSNEIYNNRPLVGLGGIKGLTIGQYIGKEALFIVKTEGGKRSIRIYEFNSPLSRITHCNIYRSDDTGNTVLLADNVVSTSFIDTTWENLDIGMYQFGLSAVFANGVESEILWSDTIVKTNYGVIEDIEMTVLLYPNPASEQLIIESPYPIRQCEIFTLDGKLIYSFSDGSEKIAIQTLDWAPGTYLIRLTTDMFVETKRFVKIE